MKRIFYLTLAVLAFTACKKNRSAPAPPDALYSFWGQEYISTPFAADATWKRATGPGIDFVLGKNGNYTGHGAVGSRGTFTVRDSANFQILSFSNAEPLFQKVYVQIKGEHEMIVDTSPGIQPADYIRRKFGQEKSGEY